MKFSWCVVVPGKVMQSPDVIDQYRSHRSQKDPIDGRMGHDPCLLDHLVDCVLKEWLRVHQFAQHGHGKVEMGPCGPA